MTNNAVGHKGNTHSHSRDNFELSEGVDKHETVYVVVAGDKDWLRQYGLL